MTADEIRELAEAINVDVVGTNPMELQRLISLASVKAKFEIAAQLAELNATMRFREAQTQICHCLDHQSSRGGTVVSGITFCDTCGKPWGAA